ncbi:MAG: glycoside hydrolase family 97 N-terminal domain-containing protein [Bacteroidaceae bacterium]|nr:glycoside hydrolase family 97 N-terminal domain-containing protein [Bacteroidaceae bacterium]
MRQALTTIIALMCIVQSVHAQYKVSSPDGNVRVELDTHREQKWIRKMWIPAYMSIRVSDYGRIVVDREIGVDVKWRGHRYSFGKIDVDIRQSEEGLTESVETRDAALQSFGETYNRLQLGVKPGIILEVRVYNEGVAYQFRVSGIDGDYKILRLCDPFPFEKPVAIEGTYTGDHILPWGVLDLEQYYDFMKQPQAEVPKVAEADSTLRPSTSPFRLVSWRDALSSLTVGASVNMYHGSVWHDMTTDYSYNINLTYKYLYAGVSYAPCNEIVFVHYQCEYEPFLNVMGSIHQWKLGGRLGLSLPFQQGLEIWNFSPYIAGSLMHIRQHGTPMPGYHKPTLHNEYLVGPGMSIQVAIAGRYVWAVNYEYQIFTGGKLTPKGMHSVGTSFGLYF